MKHIKYNCIEYHYIEKPQYDFNGDLLSDSKTHYHIIQFPVEIIVDEKRFKILVEVEVSKKVFPELRSNIKCIFTEINRELGNSYSRIESLEIFSIHYLYIREFYDSKLCHDNFELSKTRDDKIEINVEDSLYNYLQNELKEYYTIHGIIDNIIKKINRYAFDYSSIGYSEIISLVSLLTYCNECSWNAFTHNTLEAFYSIRSDIMQLIKRKKENNPTYQSLLRDLRKFSMHISVPEIWINKPVFTNDIIMKYKNK